MVGEVHLEAEASMLQELKPTGYLKLAVPDRAEKARALTSSMVALLPANFIWTEEETRKLEALGEELNCPPQVARQLLIFFLVYISTYQKEFGVAELPQILQAFPVRWGYKKKRHDFLHRLQEMGFIYVHTDYWAKVRAKRYGIGKSGTPLLTRVLHAIFHC
jgi:hypothetical protein